MLCGPSSTASPVSGMSNPPVWHRSSARGVGIFDSSSSFVALAFGKRPSIIIPPRNRSGPLTHIGLMVFSSGHLLHMGAEETVTRTWRDALSQPSMNTTQSNGCNEAAV